MVAKKLLVDDKIPACVKQIMHKHFRLKLAFLKNVCYHYLNFVPRVTFRLVVCKFVCLFVFFLMSDLLIGLQPTFLECIVIFLYAVDCSTLS